jgi:hypothetical protein
VVGPSTWAGSYLGTLSTYVVLTDGTELIISSPVGSHFTLLCNRQSLPIWDLLGSIVMCHISQGMPSPWQQAVLSFFSSFSSLFFSFFFGGGRGEDASGRNKLLAVRIWGKGKGVQKGGQCVCRSPQRAAASRPPLPRTRIHRESMYLASIPGTDPEALMNQEKNFLLIISVLHTASELPSCLPADDT